MLAPVVHGQLRVTRIEIARRPEFVDRANVRSIDNQSGCETIVTFERVFGKLRV
jgi:hypothetical protein